MRYTIINFTTNLNNINKNLEIKRKNIAISDIILSLQKPFTDITTSIYQKQIIDTQNLIKYLTDKNDK